MERKCLFCSQVFKASELSEFLRHKEEKHPGKMMIAGVVYTEYPSADTAGGLRGLVSKIIGVFRRTA